MTHKVPQDKLGINRFRFTYYNSPHFERNPWTTLVSNHFIFEINVGIQLVYSIYVILNFAHLQFWICDLEVNAKRKYQSTLCLWPSSIKSATGVRHNPAFLDLKLKRLYIGWISRYFKILFATQISIFRCNIA